MAYFRNAINLRLRELQLMWLDRLFMPMGVDGLSCPTVPPTPWSMYSVPTLFQGVEAKNRQEDLLEVHGH